MQSEQNPFASGSAESVLFESMKSAIARAERKEQDANDLHAEAEAARCAAIASRASAASFKEALKHLTGRIF